MSEAVPLLPPTHLLGVYRDDFIFACYTLVQCVCGQNTFLALQVVVSYM
jgi:hypothetical protein